MGSLAQIALMIGGQAFLSKLIEWGFPMSAGEKELLREKADLSREAESRQTEAMRKLMQEDATAKYKQQVMGLGLANVQDARATADRAAMLRLQGDLGMSQAKGALASVGETNLSSPELSQLMEQPATLKSLLGL